MKRVVLIVAGAMALLGVVLVVVGVALGGSPFYSIDAKNYSVQRGDAKCVEFDQDMDAFTAIDLDLDATDVTIKRGDTYHVHYVLDERLVPGTLKVENGTLKVYSGSEHWNISFGFNDWNFENQYVEITVPESAKLEDITLNNDAGDFKLSDLTAVHMEIKDSAGDISCSNIQAKSLSVDNDAGDINLDDVEVVKIHAEVDAGSIEFRGLKADQVDMTSSAGSIKGSFVNALSEYNVDITADVGDIEVDGTNQGSEYHVKASGDKTITMETSVGEVEISGK